MMVLFGGKQMLKKVATSDLIPYANNSRLHSDEQVNQIASSIKEFGFLNPIIIDADNGIIAGHGRVMACNKLGIKEVPCIDASHLTEAQKKAYVIADNKIALNSDWDVDLLRVELSGLQELDFDLGLTGFSAEELDDLLNVDFLEYEEDADGEVIEPPEEPKTKEGDVWILGKHRLMCGDSTSIDAVEKLMQGEKAVAVLTDPPYNQETDGGFKGKVGESLKKQSSDIAFMCDFEPEIFLPTVILCQAKNKMNATIFCNKDLVPRYLNWGVENGYSFNILVWKKPSAIPLGGSYLPDVEYCLTFRKSAKFNSGLSNVNYSKVLMHKRETGLHPTMKPVEMLENQIKIVTDANDLICDFFGGSGSTLIGCEKTNRKAYLMELDPKYCDVIINRWQTLTGEKATLESTGEEF